MFFVLLTSNYGRPVDPWPLTLDGYRSQADAAQAIRWQCTGGFAEADDMHVCRRTGRDTFVSLRTKETFTVNERSCFTQKAWSLFIDSWKDTV